MTDALQLPGASIRPRGLPAWSRQADIGDYGGDPDKEDSTTEGAAPYAWHVYRSLQSMRGTAYSPDTSGTLVHAENLAIARLMAAVYYRLPEKVVANSTPERADEKLAQWVTVLRVRERDGDQAWQLRRKCMAKFRMALGPTQQTTDDAIRELLGDVYVQSLRAAGADLATPPTNTYWPGVNPGDAALSLGGGAWCSPRAHLGVKVVRPTSGDDAQFLDLVGVQVFDLLDSLVPAWCTFEWTTGDGFLLDVSDLDFTGLDD
jgi:hypothetical protein